MSVPGDPKPPKPPQSPQTINIDPTGNLLIISIVPTRPATFHFRVSSKILSLASPLFASLFKDPTSHSKKYQVTLHGDSPESLGTLLELCHFGRISPLPTAQLRGIHSLAVLSQKYAIESPLVPWITIWAEPLHKIENLDFNKGNDLKKWLRIACVYNQGPLFKKITRQAILTGSAESLDVSGSSDSVYSRIIEKISPERINVLSKLVATALTLLGRYQTAEQICKQPTDSARCDAILLGSVLKGLMGLGVYQPIPEAPYPGMTIVGLVQKIEQLPFMWDPSHGEVCGEETRKEMDNIMGLINEVLEGVKGLELRGFEMKDGVGQEKGLVLVAVGDGDQGGKEEQEEREKEEQKEEQKQEEVQKGDKEDGANDNEIEFKPGDGDNDFADSTILGSFSENASPHHMVPDPQVPAGVIEGFLETAETIKDFGQQALFGDMKMKQDANNLNGEEEEGKGEDKVEGKKKKEDGPTAMKPATEGQARQQENMEGITSTKIPSRKAWKEDSKRVLATQDSSTNRTDGKTKNGFMKPVTEQKPKEFMRGNNKREQLRPTAREYVPSAVQNGPTTEQRNSQRTPNNRKEETKLPQPAPTAHVMARANAEALGNSWSAPGPELVQKYQRGPRYPFHPEVTVGDVSDEDHTAEVKRLKDLFPEAEIKILVEFLRQCDWNSEEAARLLISGGFLMDLTNDLSDGALKPSFPALEPAAISRQAPIMTSGKELKQETEPPSNMSSSALTVPPTPASKRTISISRLVAGTSNVAKSDLKFWPEADKAVVSRALKDPENKKSIRRLLSMFPQASADKGFIDVLYRNGWDLEKAARKLEKLGLVREEGDGSSGGAEE